jgi:hypothetical protein
VPKAPGASSFATEARRQAARILSGPPYANKPERLPDPLGGVLRAVGRAFVWAFGHPSRWLWRHLLRPGFHVTFSWLGSGGWIVALVLALGLGVLVGVVLIRRRSRIAAQPTSGKPKSPGDRISELERAVGRAEVEGNNELAVRLRFQLGLQRLEARGVIPEGRTTTSHQLRLILKSPIFDELASRHESITYAHQQATPMDVDSSRVGWGRLLRAAPSSGHRPEHDRQTAGSRR